MVQVLHSIIIEKRELVVFVICPYQCLLIQNEYEFRPILIRKINLKSLKMHKYNLQVYFIASNMTD